MASTLLTCYGQPVLTFIFKPFLFCILKILLKYYYQIFDSLLVENIPPSNNQPNPSSSMETSTQPMPTAKSSPKGKLPALEYEGISTADDHFEHVETASAALQLSKYPWKKSSVLW